MSQASSFMVGYLTNENQWSEHLPGLRLFESFPTRELAAQQAKELAERHLTEINRISADNTVSNIGQGTLDTTPVMTHKIVKLPAGYAVYNLEFGEVKEGAETSPANYDLFFVQEVKPYIFEDISGVFNPDATLLLESAPKAQ